MRASLGTVTGVLVEAHNEPLDPVEKLAVSLETVLDVTEKHRLTTD